MNKDTIISVIVPQISDATYDLSLPENKDKDIVVVLTTVEPVEVESFIAEDGSKITGTNFQRETVVKTTLGAKKARINELQGYIEGNIRANLVWQHELDALTLELPEIQNKVDEALVDWTPVKPVEEMPVDLIK